MEIFRPGHIGWIVTLRTDSKPIVEFEGDKPAVNGLSQWDLLPKERIETLSVVTPFGRLVNLPFPGTDFIQYKHCATNMTTGESKLLGYTIGCRQGEVWHEVWIDFQIDNIQATQRSMNELLKTHKNEPYYDEMLAKA